MATYDIFISYRRKDTASVQPLVDALRSRRVSVWFDQTEIDEFAPITRKIREGLANSKALLVWYSTEYPRSRPCQMELTEAFIAAQREGDPRKRVWLINPENSTAHIQPIELRDEQHASALHDPQQYEDLASIIALRLESLTGLLGGIIPLVPPPQYGQRLVSARNFVGRVADFWKLHSALSGADSAIISGESGSGFAQLSGIGGVGKSLFAEEYALRFGAAYPGGIFWLRALGNDAAGWTAAATEQSELRADQIRSFAIAVGIAVQELSPQDIQSKLAIKLASDSRPFLWIVDDLASGLDADSVRGWLPPHPLGKTIFTSRNREYEEMGHGLSLGGLAPAEAIELLCSYRKPNSAEDEIVAEGIASDLGYHPLALAVCSRALQAESGLRNFVEFRIGLADRDADELELASKLEGVLPNGHEKSVATTLLRSVRRLGAEGQDFLRMATSLAAAPIPPSLVLATFAEVDKIDKSTARRRALVALSQVENASLSERTKDNNQLVHTLVSRTIRFHDRNDERRAQLQAALVSALNKTLPAIADDIRSQKRLEYEVLHARELCSAGIKDTETAMLGLWVACHDYERGAYVIARKLQEQVLGVTRSREGEGHPLALTAMHNLSLTLKAQGDLDGARTLQEKVVEISRRSLGEDDLRTLTAMNNLAEILRDQEDLVTARTLHEQVLEVSQRKRGAEHRETLISMSNLAETLKAQGDLASAQRLEEQALEVRLRTLGEEHSETLGSMNNLGETLRDRGDLVGARKLEERALEVSCRVLGSEHLKTLGSMHNLASTLKAQGDLTAARKLQEQVVELRRRILGENHRYTLASMNNLAEMLRAQGELGDARKLLEDVLEIKERIQGEDHLGTLATKNNLGSTLRDQGDLAGARKLEEEVLEVTRLKQGEDHLNTLNAKGHLATTLRAQGDLGGARNLIEQVIEGGRRTLGEEHPITIASMNNMAWILGAEGDLAGARKLQEEALKASRHGLGPQHPETINSMQNLATTLMALGDFAGARNLLEQVLEIRRRDQGEEHPITLMLEWNYLMTLVELGDRQGAISMVGELAWLLKRDRKALEASQQQIRQMIEELLMQKPWLASNN